MRRYIVADKKLWQTDYTKFVHYTAYHHMLHQQVSPIFYKIGDNPSCSIEYFAVASRAIHWSISYFSSWNLVTWRKDCAMYDVPGAKNTSYRVEVIPLKASSQNLAQVKKLGVLLDASSGVYGSWPVAAAAENPAIACPRAPELLFDLCNDPYGVILLINQIRMNEGSQNKEHQPRLQNDMIASWRKIIPF